MKLAVFSDVQANLPALEEAVGQIERWRPDLVVMAGDLVNRGPDSGGCLRLFTEQRRLAGWLPVAGNHEQWVLESARPQPRTAGELELRRFTDWAWGQVAADVDHLRGWPDHLSCCPPGADGTADAWVHVTHGSLLGNRDGIGPRTTDAALAAGRLPELTGLFVCGHTHKPVVRRFGPTLVVNAGSVGQPFDGDPRGSWARCTWRGGAWRAEIVRFAYDRARARRDFEDSGFLDQGTLARLVYLEWERAEGLIAGWRARWYQEVVADRVDLTHSVEAYLRERGIGWGRCGGD